MKNILRGAAIFPFFVCMLATPQANALIGQPGTLDATWNATGKVITAFGSGDDIATAIALQPDGRVLVAGWCSNGANNVFCAARYLANGALDIAWNGTGKVMTSIGGGNDYANGMTLQPDGKVLLAGSCYNGTNNDFCAARYLPNGTLDTTWNGNGKVITPIGLSDDYANAITLQPDGKILLAGRCTNGTYFFCAARYHANGTLDTAWNGTGSVVTPIGGLWAGATTMALQNDGKVLMAGYCFTGPSHDFCAARYLPNGTLDITWNGNGKVITWIRTNDNFVRAMTLQLDGRVLVAGVCSDGTDNEFCAARYLAYGTLDSAWNGTGKVITSIGGSSDVANAMTLEPDGKVLLAGSCYNGTNSDFCAARYLTNGTLDTTWNGTGKVITPIGSGNDRATAMTLQPDGKVLVAGYCFNGTKNDFCAARYDGTSSQAVEALVVPTLSALMLALLGVLLAAVALGARRNHCMHLQSRKSVS